MREIFGPEHDAFESELAAFFGACDQGHHLVGQSEVAGGEEPAAGKFVVSPNAPVRQIWLSALSRSFKLTWNPEASTFTLDGEPLNALVERLTRQFLGT